MRNKDKPTKEREKNTRENRVIITANRRVGKAYWKSCTEENIYIKQKKEQEKK